MIVKGDEKHVDCAIKAPTRNADGVIGKFGAHFPEWLWGLAQAYLQGLSASLFRPAIRLGRSTTLTDYGGRLHEARSYVRLKPISNNAAAEFSLRIPVGGNFIRPMVGRHSAMRPPGNEGLEELEAS